MAAMKSYASAMGLLFWVGDAVCASTKVTEQTPLTAPGLARPNQIGLYDFVAAPSDMPADSSVAGQIKALTRIADSRQSGGPLWFGSFG
jgi:hypothetical protein